MFSLLLPYSILILSFALIQDEDESESEIRSPPFDEKALLSIKAIIAHINKTALQEKELYQQVGSVAEQRELNALFADQRITDLRKYSPHSITSILKQVKL